MTTEKRGTMPTINPPPILQGAFAIANAVADVAAAIRETAPKPCARCGRPHGLDCCHVGNKPYPTGPLVTGGPPPRPDERTEADYLREEVRDLTQQLLGARDERDELLAALAAEKAAHAKTRDLLGQANAAFEAGVACSWRAALHAAGWEIQDRLDEAGDGPLSAALAGIQRSIYAIPVGRQDRPDRPLWVSPDAVKIAVTEARAEARRVAIEDAALAADGAIRALAPAQT